MEPGGLTQTMNGGCNIASGESISYIHPKKGADQDPNSGEWIRRFCENHRPVSTLQVSPSPVTVKFWELITFLTAPPPGQELN